MAVVLTPPDCGGRCAPWWALVVTARTAGRWVIGTARACKAPGFWGPVDGGSGRCAGCGSIDGAEGDQSFVGHYVVGAHDQNPKRLVRGAQ